MSESAITDQEFKLFQQLIYKIAGISLSDSKKVLLVGRLQKRHQCLHQHAAVFDIERKYFDFHGIPIFSDRHLLGYACLKKIQ